jgi:hypothetical protein
MVVVMIGGGLVSQGWPARVSDFSAKVNKGKSNNTKEK